MVCTQDPLVPLWHVMMMTMIVRDVAVVAAVAVVAVPSSSHGDPVLWKTTLQIPRAHRLVRQ